jgi:protein TonB
MAPPTGVGPVTDTDVELPTDIPICFNCESTPAIGNPALPVGPTDGGGTGAGTGPVRVDMLIRPPTKVHEAQPVYPDIARQARVQGKVVIECIIAPNGRVENLRVVSGHPLLQQPAADAVREWRYTPSLLDGVPVAVIMTVTVNFILNN